MRFIGIIGTSLFISLSTGLAQQQTPARPTTPSAAQGEEQQPASGQGGLHTPDELTPLQQREKQIRVYDPLDKTNPITGQEEAPQQAPKTDAPRTTPPASSSRPLPGSVAALGQPLVQRRQDPNVVPDDGSVPPEQIYTGPAVLSRSYTLTRPMVPQEVGWHWSVGVSGVRDTGLTGGNVNTNGTLANVNSFGTIVSWGFGGRHFWKHDQVGIDYAGSYNNYTSVTSYNGTNQNINLDYSHEFSRHLRLNLVESGSIFSQSYALENSDFLTSNSIANINIASSPTVQVLDEGTRQFVSSADMTWQQSARLSFNFGGARFGAERTDSALFGNSGSQARADMNYRYTRKMTVGVYYSFNDYTFTHRIEISNSHTVGGIFSYALTRTAQVRLRAGITQSESEGLTSVPVDPSIAILIGRNSTIADIYHLNRFSDISAEIAKDFRRSRTARLSYVHGIAPGNGLLMTSIQEQLEGGFSMRVFRDYTAHFGVGKTSLSSISQTIGKYSTEYAGFTVTRSYRHGLAGSMGVDYRRFKLSNVPVLQNQLRITAGITWGPGEGRLW